MSSYVIHKKNRLPGVVSYDGVTWDMCKMREKHQPTYNDYWYARGLAEQLNYHSPVGFSVTELPDECKGGACIPPEEDGFY